MSIIFFLDRYCNFTFSVVCLSTEYRILVSNHHRILILVFTNYSFILLGLVECRCCICRLTPLYMLYLQGLRKGQGVDSGTKYYDVCDKYTSLLQTKEKKYLAFPKDTRHIG